jgi:hypothetical protein
MQLGYFSRPADVVSHASKDVVSTCAIEPFLRQLIKAFHCVICHYCLQVPLLYVIRLDSKYIGQGPGDLVNKVTCYGSLFVSTPLRYQTGQI